MNIIELNNLIRETEIKTGLNFKDLFNEKQKEEIENLLDKINKNIKENV